MARKIFKYAFPIICILIVVIAFYMIFDIKNKVEENMYNTEDISNEFVDDNIIENEILNGIENDVEESNINNTVLNETNTLSNDIVPEEDIEEGSTAKKQEAIKLVKKTWGEDSSVTFRCETVKSNGEYVVAVILKSSGSVKAYFNVNLENKNVEIDF